MSCPHDAGQSAAMSLPVLRDWQRSRLSFPVQRNNAMFHLHYFQLHISRPRVPAWASVRGGLVAFIVPSPSMSGIACAIPAVATPANRAMPIVFNRSLLRFRRLREFHRNRSRFDRPPLARLLMVPLTHSTPFHLVFLFLRLPRFSPAYKSRCVAGIRRFRSHKPEPMPARI